MCLYTQSRDICNCLDWNFVVFALLFECRVRNSRTAVLPPIGQNLKEKKTYSLPEPCPSWTTSNNSKAKSETESEKNIHRCQVRTLLPFLLLLLLRLLLLLLAHPVLLPPPLLHVHPHVTLLSMSIPPPLPRLHDSQRRRTLGPTYPRPPLRADAILTLSEMARREEIQQLYCQSHVP